MPFFDVVLEKQVGRRERESEWRMVEGVKTGKSEQMKKVGGKRMNICGEC